MTGIRDDPPTDYESFSRIYGGEDGRDLFLNELGRLTYLSVIKFLWLESIKAPFLDKLQGIFEYHPAFEDVAWDAVKERIEPWRYLPFDVAAHLREVSRVQSRGAEEDTVSSITRTLRFTTLSLTSWPDLRSALRQAAPQRGFRRDLTAASDAEISRRLAHASTDLLYLEGTRLEGMEDYMTLNESADYRQAVDILLSSIERVFPGAPRPGAIAAARRLEAVALSDFARSRDLDVLRERYPDEMRRLGRCRSQALFLQRLLRGKLDLMLSSIARERF
jgi:hypothetical protein